MGHRKNSNANRPRQQHTEKRKSIAPPKSRKISEHETHHKSSFNEPSPLRRFTANRRHTRHRKNSNTVPDSNAQKSGSLSHLLNLAKSQSTRSTTNLQPTNHFLLLLRTVD